ncbi:MAG: electron transfer flavoprotein subunit alpha/FixB family protein [Deltaproteobacteria bacterium]|nr:electron transfer flavoprotein subunit alpha/FixB family protein [Deltaproteobacteria bacterium]MBW2253350.1 electron transfer flavoprotein subunit alpha/FixB family protein [Deltaproteobacteria bacterium]
MSGILVLAEHEDGKFKKTAFELIGKSTELAATLGTKVAAVVLGDAPAGELGAFGATTVYQVAGDFSTYGTLKIVAALAAVIAQDGSDVFLAPTTFTGRDAIPRLAARLGTGQGSDCTDLKVDGALVVARRPMYAGKAYVDVRITKKPAIFTVRPNSFGQPEPAGGSAEVVAVQADLSAPDVELVDSRKPESEAVDLTEATRIVSGGRALKTKENFDGLMRPLAAAVGATVGASRAAVDAGLAPHSDQVGQTGKTVNPNLYIACGISGAIQHLAGMRTSKVIVAVNTDAEAPIFEHATYGIVGDLFQVCPVLLEAFQKELGTG